jgi:hypothetical protein
MNASGERSEIERDHATADVPPDSSPPGDGGERAAVEAAWLYGWVFPVLGYMQVPNP